MLCIYIYGKTKKKKKELLMNVNYRDSLEDIGIIVEIFEQPREHAGRGVVRCKYNSDDVVCDLRLTQSILLLLLFLNSQHISQQSSSSSSITPSSSLLYYLPQRLIQRLPRLRNFQTNSIHIYFTHTHIYR